MPPPAPQVVRILLHSRLSSRQDLRRAVCCAAPTRRRRKRLRLRFAFSLAAERCARTRRRRKLWNRRRRPRRRVVAVAVPALHVLAHHLTTPKPRAGRCTCPPYRVLERPPRRASRAPPTQRRCGHARAPCLRSLYVLFSGICRHSGSRRLAGTVVQQSPGGSGARLRCTEDPRNDPPRASGPTVEPRRAVRRAPETAGVRRCAARRCARTSVVLVNRNDRTQLGGLASASVRRHPV